MTGSILSVGTKKKTRTFRVFLFVFVSSGKIIYDSYALIYFHISVIIPLRKAAYL